MATAHKDMDDMRGFTRRELFFLLKGHLNDKTVGIYTIVEEEMSRKLKCHFKLTEEKKMAVRNIVHKMKVKWQEVNRTEEKFLNKFVDWLGKFVVVADKFDSASTESTSRGGRPSCAFSESSERSKRRKTEDIRNAKTSVELAYSTRMKLKAEGKVDAAHVLRDITVGSPSKPSKYRKSLELVQENTLSDNEALSVLVESRLSKNQYQILRQTSRAKNCKLFPHYAKVLKAKKGCYPTDSQITITESKAFVTLQALLDHTAERILLTQSDVVTSLPSEEVCDLNLICKWGCDGTSSQSTYKQKFTDGDCDIDSNIFFTSVVPLEMSYADQKKVNIIVWKNPRPSSTRYCRPIRIQFLHETPEVTRKEVEEIKEQEKNLTPFKTIVSGKEINVNYKLAFTMIDGKICNSVANVLSSLRCYLCEATAKDFNDIDKILRKPISDDYLQFGISSLHAWIRFFECCLHLSYRLDIKKWQIRSADEKESVEKRKNVIQKHFREQLGLIVDRPKQGYGSTNDGNTARRFFENYTTSANITGVDERLIKKFHVILQAICCGFEVDIKKFEEYALDTARYFVQLYPWFYMPTSVHKILIHGHRIIDSALLPIGQMSEEAQESCNKYIKRYREYFARKSSRKQNIEDVFRRLLIASDPLISSLRKLPAKRLKSLSAEAIELLVAPSIPEITRNISSPNRSEESESDNESNDSSESE